METEYRLSPVVAAIIISTCCALLATGTTAFADAPPQPQATHWTLTSEADWRAGALEGLAVAADDEDDGTLTLAHGRAAGRFTSPVHQTPFAVTAAAVFWRSDTTDGSGLTVELRLSQDGATWSPWYPIYHPETQSDGRTYGENIVAFDGAQFVQVQVALSALTPTRLPNLHELTVVLIDASDAPAPAQALVASAAIHPSALDRPIIISRQAWGADPIYLDWDPEYAPVGRMVLHHTVTAGGSNPISEVQAIYYYHAVTRGWGDIGYNYLVDGFGNVYEGRYGGDDVIGAHTARWNSGALGVALLGCYDPDDCSPEQTPSPAALDAIVDLMAWTASRRVIDPRQEVSFTNPYDDPSLTLYRLAGHRDYSQYLDGQWYNATSCPGEALYDELVALRAEAWSRLPDHDVRFEDHETPSLLKAGQSIAVSLSVRNAGLAPWRPGEVYLGYIWLDQDGTPVSQTTDAGSLSSEVAFGDWLPMTGTLNAPSAAGTYTLRWDLYRQGAGWFAEFDPASQPLEVSVSVVDPASLSQRLLLPVLVRGDKPLEICPELLVNGGAESDQAWEFVGGWPGVYSSAHVRSGKQAIRLGLESDDEDGFLYSSVQQTVGLPTNATRVTLSFWYSLTSTNPDDDRVYVVLLDSGGTVLYTFQLATSNAHTWQSVNFDLTTYRGQTAILRFTVLNKSSPGITAAWFDDISLAACGP